MTSPITYHRLTRDTAPLLAGADVFDHPVRADQLDAFVGDAGHELVFAMEGATAVGIASGCVLLHPDKAPAFFVNEVGVLEAWQRRGIGAELTQRLLDLARARGCEGIWLATEAQNVPARALYRRLAARETGGIVVYDWDGAMDL